MGKKAIAIAARLAGGSLRPIEFIDPADVGFEDYGHKKEFQFDATAHKTVLITGAGSYIGDSFREYTAQRYPNVKIHTLDMKNPDWKDDSVWNEPLDTVFHVAGIAHVDVGHTSLADQEDYYRVNTDLAIDTAEKAKGAGVKQFILMSSMIVYGSAECVDEYTLPQPQNFYGNSKWLADKGCRKLGSDDYNVAVLRSPMIYGKCSKGSYSKLSSLAQNLPVFPDIKNKRSMLFIDNLCEFVALLTLSESGGIFFPQNSEYTNTSEMVKAIATVGGKRIRGIKLLNPAVWIAQILPVRKIRNMAEKAFGSSYYEMGMSLYKGLDYQKIGLEESIRMTESIIKRT